MLAKLTPDGDGAVQIEGARVRKTLGLTVFAGLSITAMLAGGAAASASVSTAVGASATAVSGAIDTVYEGSDALTDWTGWSVDAWLSGETSPVATTTSAADGAFSLAFADSIPQGGIAYLTASAPPDPDGGTTATLAVVLPADIDTSAITVNERTTVAASYTMAQFVTPDGLTGLAPGVQNSAAMATNLADPITGGIGDVLTTSPNGSDTSTWAEFDSLTAALAACVNVPFSDRGAYPDGVCAALLDVSAAPGEATPSDTLRAFSSIARNPGTDPAGVFALSTILALPAEFPVLSSPPAAWTLALRFDGDGQSLAGPGNFAIDEKGNVWVNDNYEFAADPHTPVCDGKLLFKVSPTGEFTTVTGGGLSGVGYGIARDPANGNIWVSNFGFAAPAPLCPEADQPPHNSTSVFTSAGTPLSPATGFTQGDVDWPQGMTFAGGDSIWTANCGNNSVTVYPNADPTKAWNLPYEKLGLEQPFDIVDNGHGLVISGIVNSSVAMVDYEGHILPQSPGAAPAFDNPMGLARDADGNVWVANSSLITLPCPTPPGGTGPFADGNVDGLDEVVGSVALVTPDGSATEFTGGGTTVAWGISTDGDGNVWVANFAGKRLSEFCGADPSTCPQGLTTGDAISPDVTGYFFDGLTRNTATAVDQSGNVWVTNNWLEVPIQANPGGHQIVAFLGLAAPTAIAPPTGGGNTPSTPTTPQASAPELAESGSNLVPILLTGAGALGMLIAGCVIIATRRRATS